MSKIQMLLDAQIDPKAIGNIKSQINKISGKAIKLNVQVDKKAFKDIESINRKLGGIKAPVLNTEKNTKGMQGLAKATNSAKVNMAGFSKTAENSGSILGRALENSFKFLRFYAIGGAIVGFVNSIKNGVKSVKTLDTAMVELKKVTDVSEQTYVKFTETAFNLGKELGRTGTEVIQASADFARMGFTLEESMNLANEALLMLNVGDGIENLGHATSSIIATLKGFQVESENTAEATRRINDVYNEVANNFAVATGDIAEGVRRTSAVMNQAGNSFEETVALFTGGFEVMQDSSKVSSGLNIITQRLKAIDEEGNTIVGLAPKLEGAFKKLGLSLYDTDGNLKSTYDNLQALAEIYPTLSKEQQNYMSELVSGKRQAVVLQAILGNFETIKDVIIATDDATGSAMKENEIYLDSIEGKMAQLKSSGQMFWKNMIDSEAIKTTVDSVNKFIEVLDKLMNNDITSYILKVGLLSGALILLGKGAVFAGGSLMATTVGYYALQVAQVGLIATTKALTVAMLASPLFWVVAGSAAVVGLVTYMNKFNNTLKEVKKTVSGLTGELEGMESEYKSLMDIEYKTPEQEKHLQLLKQEIGDKKELLKLNSKIQVQEEFFERSSYSYGGVDYEKNDSGSDAIEKDIETLKKLGEEFKNTDDIAKRAEIKKKILETRIELQETSKTLLNLSDNMDGEVTPAHADLQVAIDGVLDSTKEYGAVIEEQEKILEDQVSTLNELYDEVSLVTDEYSLLTSALEELNEEGQLSKSTIKSLVEIYPDLLDATGLQEDATRDLLEAMLTKNRSGIQASIKENEAIVKAAKSNIEAYRTEILALRELINARGEAYIQEFKGDKQKGKSYGELVGDWNNTAIGAYEQRLNYIQGEIGSAQSNIDEADKKLGIYKNSLKTMDNIDAGDGKKKKKSGKSPKDNRKYLDTLDAEIRLIKIKNDNLVKSKILLEEQLTKASDDNTFEGINKQLELTGQLIAKNKEIFKSFKDEQTLLHKGANDIREAYSQYDIDSWFDANAEGTVAFDIQFTDASSKEMQDEMQKIFGDVQKIKNGWMDSDSEIANNIKSTKELEKSIETINDKFSTAVSNRVSASKDWMDKRKFYDDWGSDNEIAAWGRVREYIEQYYADGIISHKEYIDYKLDIDKNYLAEQERIAEEQEKRVKKQQELALYLVNQEISALELKKQTIQENSDKRIVAIEQTISLLQERIDLINEEESTIKKLQETSQYIVNEEITNIQIQKDEVNKLYSDKINAIEGEINRLQEKNQVLEQEEKRQDKLLEIEKQKERLANTIKEKNIRIFRDGKWDWIADPKAVKAETDDLERLQVDYNKDSQDLANQKEIDGLQTKIDSLKQQKEIEERDYENQVFNLQEFIKEHERITSEFHGEEVSGLENLMNIIKGIESSNYEDRIEKLKPYLAQYSYITKQSQLDKLQDERKSTENAIKEHNKRIEAIRVETERVQEQYNTQINNLQEFMSKHDEQTHPFYAQQIDGMADLIEGIKNVETDGYSDRLIKLGEFVSDYLALASQADVGGSPSGGSNNDHNLSVMEKGLADAKRRGNPKHIKQWEDSIRDYKGKYVSSGGSNSSGNVIQTVRMKSSGGSITNVNPDYVDDYLKKGYTKLHKGGMVGDGSRDLPEIVNKMFNTKPNEQMVKALKGELFIPRDNIFKNFIPNMKNVMQSKMPIAGTGSTHTYHVQIDKVETKNADSFINILPNLVKQYK